MESGKEYKLGWIATYVPAINRVLLENIFIILLVEYSFIQRLTSIYYGLGSGVDVSMHYLIASHIQRYKEFILLGPAHGNIWMQSPLYFYLLAALLFAKPGIVTLFKANILLQIVPLYCLYIVAKRLFSPGTAYCAALLFAFSTVGLALSGAMSDPYASHAFLSICYALLAIAWTRKKSGIPLIIASVIAYAVACSLYIGAFAILPLMAVLFFFALRRQEAGKESYVLAALSGLFILGLAHLH